MVNFLAARVFSTRVTGRSAPLVLLCALVAPLLCQMAPASAQAASLDDPLLGSGLHPRSDEAFFNPVAGMGWLRSGLSLSQGGTAAVKLPWKGSSLGLSAAQAGQPDSLSDASRASLLPGVYGRAMRVEASYLLGDSWGLSSEYAFGTIASSGSRLGGAQGFSASRELVGVGVFRNGNLLRGDRLTLTLSSAMHTGVSGALADNDGAGGSALLDDRFPGLRVAGRDYRTEVSYYTPLGAEASVGFSVSQSSGNMRDYGTPEERMMSIRFLTHF